jgi:hypothetical protein
MSSNEVIFGQERGEPFVPDPGGLVKVVNRFLKTADVVRMYSIFKIGGLDHIKLLVQRAMEEGRAKIGLSKIEIFNYYNGQQGQDAIKFRDRRKSLCVVDVVALDETPSNQLCLVPIDVAGRIIFELIRPLAADGMASGRKGDQFPSIILQKGLELSLHG